ncbi:MAG: bifunctional methionine sulfoxide reductase B/A protein [Rickettsiales bacterium]|nr:bifunctional methionine sulfoxide reductase B/A protein [Rickettsiales bacterium]
MELKKLTPQEAQVILHKATEAPFSGEFYENNRHGKYLCKQCNAELFTTKDQFDSGCGWPSFDDEFPNSVKKVLDRDGSRTEILCQKCGGHLGHIFHGEGFTTKDARYCVNSISLNFVEENLTTNQQIAYFAAGCFWGVEYFFSKERGVKSAISGYMGGSKKNPTYEQVCRHETGHLETVKVVFDKSQTDFETLAKLFFEIHDPEQKNGQGPDIGEQYLSAIFYIDEEQKNIAQKLIKILQEQNLKIATKLLPANSPFYNAELYHQNYYAKNGKTPYCHRRVKRFF